LKASRVNLGSSCGAPPSKNGEVEAAAAGHREYDAPHQHIALAAFAAFIVAVIAAAALNSGPSLFKITH
jgi:hypothetical protein